MRNLPSSTTGLDCTIQAAAQGACTTVPVEETYGYPQRAFDHFNAQLFDHVLPATLITLQRQRGAYGYFAAQRFGSRADTERQTHEIALNPATFRARTDAQILSTLVHEMCHLWQQCFGRPGRRGYHNREWAGAMLRVGLHPSDTGAPGGQRVGERVSHYIVAGDRFDRACAELIDQGFKLVWQDQLGLAVPAGPAGTAVPASTESAAAAVGRRRFDCPLCKLKAWARPAARLICGACDTAML